MILRLWAYLFYRLKNTPEAIGLCDPMLSFGLNSPKQIRVQQSHSSNGRHVAKRKNGLHQGVTSIYLKIVSFQLNHFKKKKFFFSKKYCYFFFILCFSFFFRGTMDTKSHHHPQPGYPIQTTYVGLISKLNHFHRGGATTMVGAFKNIL